MFEYNVKINQVKIRFKFADQIIKKYLNDEFLSYKYTNDESVDCEIMIYTKPYVLPNNATQFNENLYYDNNVIIQKIDAKFRKTWIEYELVGSDITRMNVYLISPNFIYNTTFKLISRYSIGVLQNSLIDFFHGPFLGVMQLKLLEKNASFIHASSLSYNDKGVMFLGEAQSGKTTLVNLFLESNSSVKFISEDLTIIDGNSNINGYLKQATSHSNSYNFTKRFSSILPQSIIKYKKKIIRMTDLYDMNKIIDKEELELVFNVSRSNEETNVQVSNLEVTVDESIRIMTNEMKNFNGFYDVVTLMDEQFDTNLIEDMNSRMHDIYTNALYDKKIYNLNLKVYKDIKNIYTDVDVIISRLFEGKS